MQQFLIKVENGVPVGYPMTVDNFKQTVPNELPNRHLLKEDVEFTGYELFRPTDAVINRNTLKKVIEVTPTEKNEDGEWLQKWEIVDRDDLTEEEKQEIINIENAYVNEALQFEIITAVQSLLDTKAREKKYDNILSAVSYASSNHPVFGPEGIAFRNWRDAVWDHCYQILEDVTAGNRIIPTVEEVLNELPQLSFE